MTVKKQVLSLLVALFIYEVSVALGARPELAQISAIVSAVGWLVGDS